MAVWVLPGAAAAVMLMTASTALAQDPPVIVLEAKSAGSVTHKAAATALRRIATSRGTVVIDLSPAQAAQPQAAGLLGRAVEAYHAFDYGRAIELLDDAIADAELTGAAGLDKEQLSDLHLFRALSHTQRSDSAAAWADLARAAAIDPSRVLDSMRFPPRVVKAFGRAVDSVRGDTVSVTIAVPDNCSTWLDARPTKLGETSTVARGEHYLRVSCSDYEPYGARKLLTADTSLEPALVARPEPNLLRAADEAKTRGAATVLWVRETTSKLGVTLTMQLIDVDTAKIRGSVIVRGDGRLANAADRLIAKLAEGPEIRFVEPPKPEPTPWYARPWVWGVVGGAAVATAILLPFVLDSGEPGSFDLGLAGDAP